MSRRAARLAVARAAALLAVGLGACAEPRQQPGGGPTASDAPTGAGPGGARGTDPVDAGATPGVPAMPGMPDAPGPGSGSPDAPGSPAPDAASKPDGPSPPVPRPGKAAPGELCKVDQDCQSSVCRREICCAGPCALCQSCRGPGGSCMNVPVGEDDYQGTTRCANGRACDGAGNCRSTVAQPCTRPADCPTGFCTDGVCCDRACTGACETCAGPFPGTCAAVSDRADEPTCPGEAAVCLGAGRCGAIDQRQFDAGATSPVAGKAIGQIIVPGRTGRLGGVRIRAYCTGEARLAVAIVEVASGRPGQQVLASSSLAQDQLSKVAPTGGAPPITLFTFDPAAAVVAGRPVALVVSDSAGFCSVTMQGHLDPADPYPAGAVFRRAPDGTWLQDTGDLWFETVVTP